MFRRLITICAVLLVLGCGGGGGGSSVGGTTITDARRAVVLDQINEKFTEIRVAGGSVDSQNQAIAAFIAGMPEFAAAGAIAEADCAWGRFNDGRLVVIGNNRFPDRAPPASQPWVPSPRASFVAKSKQARLMHAFGPNFDGQDPIIDMSRYLQKDNLYTLAPTSEGKARLPDLRSIRGDAFWYINAHSGRGVDSANQEAFVVASSTPHNENTDRFPEIIDDFNNGRITYYLGLTGQIVNNVEISEWTYAITHKFVSRYMSFDTNAVVFLNVCHGGNVHFQTGLFRSALIGKGAGAVLAWTELCYSRSAYDAARYFVDRLVAANDFQKESPDQRAFAINEVMADMARKGKDRDTDSRLVVAYKSGVSNLGLRPNIRLMEMDETMDQLVLRGEFGSEVGQVFVDDVEATLVGGWDSSELKVRIPASGAGSEGPVVVQVHDKKSKERQLTSWRGTFTYAFRGTSPGLDTRREDATANLHFRADIEPYRMEAGGALIEQQFVTLKAAKDSTLTWSCGGQVEQSGVVLIRWSGSGSPQLVELSTIQAPGNAWAAEGSFSPSTRTFFISLFNGGTKTLFLQGGGNQTVFPLSQGSYSKPLDANWSGPPLEQTPPEVRINWSRFTVSSPPPTPFYRPLK